MLSHFFLHRFCHLCFSSEKVPAESFRHWPEQWVGETPDVRNVPMDDEAVSPSAHGLALQSKRLRVLREGTLSRKRGETHQTPVRDGHPGPLFPSSSRTATNVGGERSLRLAGDHGSRLQAETTHPGVALVGVAMESFASAFLLPGKSGLTPAQDATWAARGHGGLCSPIAASMACAACSQERPCWEEGREGSADAGLDALWWGTSRSPASVALGGEYGDAG